MDEGIGENCRHTETYKAAEPEQYKNLLKTLAELQECKAPIKAQREWERDVVQRTHELMPRYQMRIKGFGIVTRSNNKNKKWDNDETWNVLIARALDSRLIDKETGEVLEREASAVRRVIEECAYISYWKTTPLEEKYGIDPDEYYETTSVRPSIRIQ